MALYGVVAVGLLLPTAWGDETRGLQTKGNEASAVRTADGTVYHSIAQAVEASPAGSTIQLGRGVYRECLVIRKPIRLCGAGWEETRIMPPPGRKGAEHGARGEEPSDPGEVPNETQEAPPVRANDREELIRFEGARGVTLQGITLQALAQDGTAHAATTLRLQDSQVRLVDCVIGGWAEAAIEIGGGSDLAVLGCLVTAAGAGIRMAESNSSSRLSVVGCEFRRLGIGILACREGDLSVLRSRFDGLITGLANENGSPLIVGSVFTRCPMGGVLNQGERVGGTIARSLFTDSSVGVLVPARENHMAVYGNTFLRNTTGVRFSANSSDALVSRNVFASCEWGFAWDRMRDEGGLVPLDLGPVLRGNVFCGNDMHVEHTVHAGDEGTGTSVEAPGWRNGNTVAELDLQESDDGRYILCVKPVGLAGVCGQVGPPRTWPIIPLEARLDELHKEWEESGRQVGKGQEPADSEGGGQRGDLEPGV